MEISVIVPVYNEEENIARTIESLLNQTFKDYEIIAVNDASTDNSIDVLNRYKDRIKIIDKKKNEGQAKTLNAGLKISKGDIIARTDGDSVVPADWLMRIHNNFKNDDIIGVGGWLAVANENSYWALANNFKDVIFNGVLKKAVTPNVLPGANNAVLASALREIGGYPDKKIYSEDFLLFSKLNKMGKVIRDDNLVIKTYYPEKFIDSIKRKFFWGVAGSSLFGNANTYKFYLRPLYYIGLITLLISVMVCYFYASTLSLMAGILFLLVISPMTLGVFLISLFYILKSTDYKYLKVLPTTILYPFLLEFVYFIGLIYGLSGGNVKVWREV